MDLKNLLCLKCNVSLQDTKLKRYCRNCITIIKNDRVDKQNENELCCKKCKCFKSNEHFKNILLTCKTCRTRKEKQTDINNTNKDIGDNIEKTELIEDKITKKSITKINYKSKLQSILIYLKTKYDITESIEHLETIDNTLSEEVKETKEEDKEIKEDEDEGKTKTKEEEDEYDEDEYDEKTKEEYINNSLIY